MNKRSRGLTLIEVLIALAVLAIALTAIVRATIMNINEISYLRDKTIASWIAGNLMTQQQLGLTKNTSQHTDTTIFLGNEWYWSLDVTATKNPAVYTITIRVRRTSSAPPLVVLNGFKRIT